MTDAKPKLRQIIEEARAREPRKTEAAVLFNERVCEHLAWCMSEGYISFDRAREILGVSTETMREAANEWVALGWLKPDDGAL